MKVKDNLILGGMFLFLLVFYILQQTVFKPEDSSYRNEVTSFNAFDIDRIDYKHKDEIIYLSKTNDVWTVSDGQINFEAKTGAVESLLEKLSNIRTKLLVTRNQENWALYEVDDLNANIYQFYQGEYLISSIHIGKFNVDDENPSGLSYVRLSDEDETYSVDGILSKTASRDLFSFRENSLLTFNPGELNQIKLISGDLEELISKRISGKWFVNGNKLDAVAMEGYIRNLLNLSGISYNDRFKPGIGFGVIKSISLNNDITIDCYLNPEGGFVIKSNFNEAFFNSDSSGIYQQIFTDLENIMILANS